MPFLTVKLLFYSYVRSDRRIVMINTCACVLLGSVIFLGGAILSSFKLIKGDMSKVRHVRSIGHDLCLISSCVCYYFQNCHCLFNTIEYNVAHYGCKEIKQLEWVLSLVPFSTVKSIFRILVILRLSYLTLQVNPLLS